MQTIDQEKYLQILRTQGLSAALTELHRDLWKLEHETFEGQDGWRPDLWKVLNEGRAFQRKLWEFGLYQTPMSTQEP